MLRLFKWAFVCVLLGLLLLLINICESIYERRHKLFLLAAASLIGYLLAGCQTFESAFRRYGHTVTDTTTVTVPVVVTIPRDSAVITTRTDTSRVVIEERSKTSWVRLYRDKNLTRVEGGCDSASIAKDVLAKVPRKQAIWGVDPSYKTGMERWRTVAIVLFALGACATGFYLFTRRFIVTPRNGTPAQPN